MLITSARNDDDLARALGSAGIRVPLTCGDVNFGGVGANGSGLSICVERKKLGDLAQCIVGGRYIFQAQNAHAAGFDVLCLIYEGEMRVDPITGLVRVPVYRSRMSPKSLRPRTTKTWVDLLPNITFSRVDQFLTELDYLTGIIVKRSDNVHMTAAIIKSLWLNFQTSPDGHGSLKQLFAAPPPSVDLLQKPTLVRRVAKELPNVGWERSRAVNVRFRTVREMVNASVEEWREIPGIGAKTSTQVVQALSGGDED